MIDSLTALTIKNKTKQTCGTGLLSFSQDWTESFENVLFHRTINNRLTSTAGENKIIYPDPSCYTRISRPFHCVTKRLQYVLNLKECLRQFFLYWYFHLNFNSCGTSIEILVFSMPSGYIKTMCNHHVFSSSFGRFLFCFGYFSFL